MKVLIVGIGSIAKKHIEALQIINSDVEIFTLRRRESSPLSDSLKVKELFNIEDIPADVNFIIISNPTSVHYNTIKDLAHLGKPFFIEKPITNDINQAIQLKNMLEPETTYIACNLRYHPAIGHFRSLLQTKKFKIDQVNIYCGSYLPDWRPGIDYRKSYSAIEELGGGVHLDLIHELDYCYWLFGKPEKTSSFLKSKSHIDINSVDQALYILDYKDFFASVSLNYFRKDTKRTLEVISEKNTYEINLVDCCITKNGVKIFEDQNYNVKSTYLDQLRYYLSCLEKNITPMNSTTEATEVLKICLNNERS